MDVPSVARSLASSLLIRVTSLIDSLGAGGGGCCLHPYPLSPSEFPPNSFLSTFIIRRAENISVLLEKKFFPKLSLSESVSESRFIRSDNWQESGKSDALRERDTSFILESTPTRLPPPTFPRVLRLP